MTLLLFLKIVPKNIEHEFKIVMKEIDAFIKTICPKYFIVISHSFCYFNDWFPTLLV